MADFIQLPVVQALAWALVHFLWQGAAIGLAALLTFRVVRTSAQARYAIGVGALAAMIAAPVATFLTLANQPSAAAASVLATAPVVNPPSAPAATIVWSVDVSSADVTPSLRVSPDVLAVAVLAWFAGVAFFAVRLLGGWIVASRMAWRAVRPASESIQALARQLAERLQVDRVVMVLESSAIAVPVMVGWLKPAVVLPMAALAGLSPAQMEALLAHELAHVRRHDYLVNLLQSVAEALLFYHPAVWWLSRRVRAERELCCDDLAVGVCDRLVYATALTDLAAMTSPRIALAATDGDLLSRVRRILGQADATPRVRSGVMPVLALALVAGAAVSVTFASATQAPASKPAPLPPSVESSAAPSQATVTLEGQASGGEAFDGLAVEQTPEQQAERQRQVEAARRQVEDLRRMLEQLAAQLKAQRDVEPTAQMAEQYQKTVEQYTTALAQAERDAAMKREMVGQLERSQELTAARKQFEAQAMLQRAEAAGTAQVQAAVEGQRAALEAEIRLARAKALFEKGLMTEQQVREAEVAVAKAQAAGNAEALNEVQLKEAQAKLERARELYQKGLTTQQSVADLEAALKALAARLNDLRGTPQETRPEVSAADRDRNSARQLYELLEARRAEPGGTTLLNDRNLVAVADAAELVKTGDVLRVTIEGEPDLPNTFNVSADGTIRMPFLGSIKVVGLTSANVRATVGKLLSDRKLGTPAQVKVTLMRPSRAR